MTRSFGPLTTHHKNQLASEWPFVWLYELQTDDDPPQMYRLTNNLAQITQKGNTFYPAPITHSGVRIAGDGSLPRIDFTLHNSTLEVATAVEANDGFIGNFVRVQLVSIQEVDVDGSGWIEEGEVVGVRMTSDGLTVSVAAANLYKAQFPPFRYTRKRCRWLFGSNECGYDLNATGASYTACPAPSYTLEACELVGADELANGLTVRHPERFGAEPGIAPTRNL